MATRSAWFLAALLLGVAPAQAYFDSGSDGSDGAFNPQASVEIDLGLAATATWNTPSPVTGHGVYDADKWAVVFKYTTINIPLDVIITFKNHPSGAPVVWLAQGDVTIAGQVNLNGASVSSEDPLPAKPGPGGFAGGVRGASNWVAGPGAGFGPGGAPVVVTSPGNCGSGGGFAGYGGSATCSSPSLAGGGAYGNLAITPLIGGSGGSGGVYSSGGGASNGGGAGGGALLIAAGLGTTPALISVSGGILARGGNGGASSGAYGGGGSGGAIRMIAEAVTGSAAGLVAIGGGAAGSGGSGSWGRIRADSPNITLTGNSSPGYTTDLMCAPAFPEDPPILRVVSVDGSPVSSDPLAGIATTDVNINNAEAAVIEIQASGIPAGTIIKVRVVPLRGQNAECPVPNMTCDSSPLVDTGGGLLTAAATVTFTPGRSEIQLRANW